MRIIQLMPTISYGDAVSNDALAVYHLLKARGYKTLIFAENIGSRVPAGAARYYEFKNLKNTIKNDDIILYHGSTGTKINEEIPFLPGRKILRYHNVTPPHFFHGYSHTAEQLTRKGLEQFKGLNNAFQRVIAVSSFNRDCLIDMGYHCRMDVCPVLIPFEDYKKKPEGTVLEQYRDGKTNILFVGRIAPNKKQEDVIASFFAYQKLYDSNSRLIFVGSWDGMEVYYQRLIQYVKKLGIADKVIFTGHISFAEILAFYCAADLFLCMSEHEGFCVPLVEAMLFHIPVIAYDKCAVKETLGGSGFLLEKKDPVETAAVMNRVLSDLKLRELILKNQEKRLKDFQTDKVGEQFTRYLQSFLMESGKVRRKSI